MLKLSAIQLRNMSDHHQQFSDMVSSQCDKVPCSPCPFLRRDRKKVIVLSESAERKRRRSKSRDIPQGTTASTSCSHRATPRAYARSVFLSASPCLAMMRNESLTRRDGRQRRRGQKSASEANCQRDYIARPCSSDAKPLMWSRCGEICCMVIIPWRRDKASRDNGVSVGLF